MKKALSVLGDILTAIILIFAITITVMVISSVRSEDRVPNLFGYAIMNVETDSMVGENGFNVGDLIVIRMLDEEEANNLKVGDVITFKRYLNRQEYLETHRIVANTPQVNSEYAIHEGEIKDGIWYHGGETYYITQGDNTPSIDFSPETGGIEYAHAGNIVGIWEGKTVPVLGKVMKFLQSQMGFMICIVVPVALFFIYELYVFIITISRKKKEEALAEISNKEEELKAKAVAEFLAQQQAEDTKKAETPAEPEKPEAPAAPAAEMSEEEKQRIINEYLAKQAQEKKD